jgi:hypothetical protein
MKIRGLQRPVNCLGAQILSPGLASEKACLSPKVYCPGIRALGIEELPKRVIAEGSGRCQEASLGATSDIDPCKLEGFFIYEDFFRQPAASRIDDANHRCV